MQLLFFAIPALDPGLAQTELNAALATHRIVLLERQFVAAGNASGGSMRVNASERPVFSHAGLRMRSERVTDNPEALKGVALDGIEGMDVPFAMDQTWHPAARACPGGELQGTRGAGRRVAVGPLPTAPRAAAPRVR